MDYRQQMLSMGASTALLVQDFTTELHVLRQQLDAAQAENRILQQKIEKRTSDTGTVKSKSIFCSYA